MSKPEVHLPTNIEQGSLMPQDQGQARLSSSRESQEVSTPSISGTTISQTWDNSQKTGIERPNRVRQAFAWVSRRLTLVLMLSSMLTGLLLAASHLIFFNWLDGTKTEDRSIQQSHVTTISLLLVTGFKASITLAVGAAFSQHMWLVFRKRTLAIRHIEQLFNLRSNIFDVLKVRLSPGAPVLFAMAVFVWILPVATVYPPSALTVSSQRYTRTENLSVSILDPPQTTFDPWNIKITGDIKSMLGSVQAASSATADSEGVMNATLTLGYWGPKRFVTALASLMLASGKISDFPSPGGANASYTMTIPCPQLSCSQRVVDVSETSGVFDGEDIYHFIVDWVRRSSDLVMPSFTITSVERLQWFQIPKEENLNSNDTWIAFGNATLIVCQSVLSQLVLNITYVEETRGITYRTENVRDLNPKLGSSFNYRVEQSQAYVNTPESKLWVTETKEVVRNWNIWALLDAALQAMEFKCRLTSSLSTPSLNPSIENGTVQPLGTCQESELPFTDVFLSDQQRHNDPTFDTSALIDPRELNISETTINEYLINTTISALSFNIGQASVPVTVTTYHATYLFSNLLVFVLPYSLSLFLGTIFVGIGIWSWVQNGTSAADGGFLQVMTATSGRTKMEDLVRAQHIDRDNLPKKLLHLKLRYGELLDEEGVGTGVAGFGTVEETRLLRKGWRSG